MPRFEPFAALRYAADRVDIDKVVAPPYDVISAARRQTLAARDPHNVVHVDLPLEAEGPERYATAAHRLAQWVDTGILRRDPRPAFYTYRMDLDAPSGPLRTLGVLGALELSHPGEGHILPHEHTTPKAASDRLALLRATHANLSPIWGLSPAAGLTALLTDAEPLASWTGSDGTVHQLGRIDDHDRIAAVAAAIAEHPVVIADGHHRYQTSLAYRDERRDDGRPDDGAGSVLTYVVELVASELSVLAIHRLLDHLPDGLDLRAALSPFFALERVELDPATIESTMAAAGALCLVLPDDAWLATPRAGAFAGVRDLDTSTLDAAVAAIGSYEIRYQHGADNIARAVRGGDAAAGVLVRPVRVDQIAAVAAGGERMPPKSTFFNPKPSTGALFRTLD